MIYTTRSISDLVKLVDAANAVVGKDKGTSLKNQLSRFRVLGDVGSQTDSRRAFAGSVLRPGHQVEDVLQQLRLGGTRISAEQDVDLGAELAATGGEQLLLGTAEQLQQDA